MGHLTNVRAG
jgi:secreted trypsin-like serine protease